MIDFIRSGGIFSILQLGILLLIIVIMIKNTINLVVLEKIDSGYISFRINAMLFWGIFAAILGFFAYYIGLYKAMMAISMANDLSPVLIADGFANSIIPILNGLAILLISSIFWILLRRKFLSINK